ncbi:hypothetical protein MD484_g5848, partial [Candolleomyces efflorescens]
MIISDKKYAWYASGRPLARPAAHVLVASETCIKGHRSSSCKHFDRPLFEIKKKGRPVTQCEHCRELRKTKQVHVKCICDGRIDHVPAPKGTKPGFESAAFPNGVPRHALETSVAAEGGFSSDSSDPSGAGKSISCQCKDTGACPCCVPRKPAPKSRKPPTVKFEQTPPASLSVFGDPSRVQSNTAQILARIAELRPVLPRPGPIHDPPSSSYPYSPASFSPYERAYDMTHHQPLHHHPSRTPQFGGPNPNEAFFPIPSACGCGDGCRCPGCTYHNNTIVSGESAFSTCAHPERCSTCLDCTILSLQSMLPDTALSIPQSTVPESDSNPLDSVDEWVRQMMMSQDTFSTNDYTQQQQGSSSSSSSTMWPGQIGDRSEFIPRLEFDFDNAPRHARSSSLSQEFFYDPRTSSMPEYTRSRSVSTSSQSSHHGGSVPIPVPGNLQVPYRPTGRMQGLFGNALGSRSTPQLDLSSMYRGSGPGNRMSVSPVPGGQYANSSNGDPSSPADYDLSSPLSPVHIKRTDGSSTRNGRPGAARTTKDKKPRLDEELSDKTDDDEGDIDDMDLRAADDEEPSGDEYEDETPAEKRLRLAKLYLESVKGSLAEGEFDAAEIDKELIASRLKQDVLEHSGKVHQFIADSFDFKQPPQATFHARGHRLSVTSSVASESAKYLFTAGKEGSIIKWDLSSGKKLATFYKIRPASKGKGKAKEVADASVKGHTDEVYSLAISGDGKLLASAGADRRVGIWDVEKGEWIKGFSGHLGHKDVVSNVAFKKGTNQLYSASFDRTVKVYDLTSGVMGYVETLFGHQDHILGLDALRGDTCVSVGARDKTVRYWKIVDETQLVFRGGGRSRIREVLEGGLKADEEGDGAESDSGMPRSSKRQERKDYIEGSLDCVCMVDETTFLSGGDSGSISLWSTQKKKPIFTQPLAHGLDEMESSTEGPIRTPRWVTSLGCLRYSNIFASGSWDGSIRIWKLDSKLKSFSPVGTVPAPGVVNSLQLISPPKELVKSSPWMSSSNPPTSTTANTLLITASLGKEHRYGRWITQKDAKNTAAVFFFSSRTP